jgi:4,5-dihydroxyphthalate decarboxylase
MLNLSFAGDDFEIVRALREGHVSIEGVTLDFQPEMTNAERHGRMVRDLAFDVCELNVSTYLAARDQGVPITAIPVFQYRKFRHGFCFVNTSSGIRDPRDLIGQRVGGPNMQAASNVWLRGILEDEYGVPATSITWVNERPEDVGAGSSVLKVEVVRDKVVDLLLSGALPAIIMPTVPDCIVRQDPRVARLFPDYRQREIEWFGKTGLFPIMHVTAIRQELVDQHPWLPARLVAAFEAAKQHGYHRAADVRIFAQAWYGAGWEEELQILGADPWAYGLGPVNRKNLETVVGYTHAQGLISRRPTLDALFV